MSPEVSDSDLLAVRFERQEEAQSESIWKGGRLRQTKLDAPFGLKLA